MLTLKKSSVHIYVAYTNSYYSNNLTCKNATMEETDKVIKINLDLSSNLHPSKKGHNCFDDAEDLAENDTHLDYFQIDDNHIANQLGKKINNANDDSIRQLEINLGNKGLFRYDVSVSIEDESVYFAIK